VAHVVLLGDSILDNGTYANPEPSVEDHLRAILDKEAGKQWLVTLLATDGSLTSEVEQQIREIPEDATHLILSSGGNDALMDEGLMHASVDSVAEALRLFAPPVRIFAESYRRLLIRLRTFHIPITVCTVYNGNLRGTSALPAQMALMLFNDVIQRTGRAANATLLELRSICNAPSDYANPIEPSGQGGRKIAFAIAREVGGR
jgi:hypothetical protein